MKRIHAQGSLAPRDIVSRGIHQTMQDFGLSCVYLDISFKNSEWLQNRFPSIYSSCLVGGIDITKEPIPVVPAAHYSCGGYWREPRWSDFLETPLCGGGSGLPVFMGPTD